MYLAGKLSYDDLLKVYEQANIQTSVYDNQLNTFLSKFDPVTKNAVLKSFNTQSSEAAKDRLAKTQANNKSAQEWTKIFNNHAIDKAQLGISQFSAETQRQQVANQGTHYQNQDSLAAAKFTYDVNNPNSGGKDSDGSKSSKGNSKLTKDNPNYATLTKLGLDANGNYDSKTFANKYASAMQTLRTNHLAKSNDVKYTDWIKGEGAEYAKAVNSAYGNIPFFEANLSEIQKTFPPNASEYEKIEIVKQYAINPDYSINKKNTAILANNAKIELDEQILTEQYKEFANILQAMSSIHPDVTAESLTALLVEQGNLPTSILATIPKEYLENYSSVTRKSKIKQSPTGKREAFNKAVANILTPKVSKGDGSLLKDPRLK